ncbi:MAG: hypothetical protein ACE5FD_17965, partial [Anaerolineae bacterium]
TALATLDFLEAAGFFTGFLGAVPFLVFTFDLAVLAFALGLPLAFAFFLVLEANVMSPKLVSRRRPRN